MYDSKIGMIMDAGLNAVQFGVQNNPWKNWMTLQGNNPVGEGGAGRAGRVGTVGPVGEPFEVGAVGGGENFFIPTYNVPDYTGGTTAYNHNPELKDGICTHLGWA